MKIFDNGKQLRVTLSKELQQLLQERAQEFGLTMSAYARNLIIQDLRSTQLSTEKTEADIDPSFNVQRRKYYRKKLEELKY